MSQLYRLLSGKIHRLNDEGVMEKHPAPYDFVPTASELTANKWRMRLIGDIIPDDGKPAAINRGCDIRIPASVIEAVIPAIIAENTRAEDPNDITTLSSKSAILHIDSLISIEDLDTAETKENGNLPKPRSGVLRAIQTRRKYIVFQNEQAALESKKEIG